MAASAQRAKKGSQGLWAPVRAAHADEALLQSSGEVVGLDSSPSGDGLTGAVDAALGWPQNGEKIVTLQVQVVLAQKVAVLAGAFQQCSLVGVAAVKQQQLCSLICART